MKVRTYPIVRSIASYILPKDILNRPGSGGSFSSEYCYSVWLRHVQQLLDCGLMDDISQIEKVAEIGPGDSLGIGMAAILSGSNAYYGFDVIEHANLEKNIKVAEEIKSFFSEKRDIPHQGSRFIATKPYLDNYDFPQKVFKGHIEEPQLEQRLEEIKKALRNDGDSSLTIEYMVPWYEKESNIKGQVDLCFSQAVMEHVLEVDHAYQSMYEWLKPGGIISHQIDFKSHEMTNEWEGHWFIKDRMWNFLMHGRKYPINRLPYSAHVRAIEKAGFTIKNIIKDEKPNNFPTKSPKIEGLEFTEEDRTTASALIQAVK